MQKCFIAYLVLLFVWTLSVLAQKYCANLEYENLIMFFENLTYIGVAFIPVSILLIGKSFNPKSKLKPGTVVALCVIPAITQLVIWTNEFHHMFFISYEYGVKSGIVPGWYFFFYTAYSYICLIAGFIYIINFALNSRGSSHWQALLVIAGTATPLAVNICYTFDIGNFSIFSTPFAFLITMLTYMIGVFRFNLLRVSPIALRTMVDKTSDLYIVVDEHLNVLDYNEPFHRVFSPLVRVTKNVNITNMFAELSKNGIITANLLRIIDDCREIRAAISKEYKLMFGEEARYYSVEFTPLIIDDVYCGCILMFRDVTQARNDMEEIKRNQTKLIERERLASLGQLIGGIAHNLKTPIMAVSGRAESLNALVEEYMESLHDANVTVNDHLEIAREMREEILKIKSHMSYISDIITTVKDQTVKLNAKIQESFTIIELVKRIKILMQHTLTMHNCELTHELLVDDSLRLAGDINSLVQIIDNIILNAIQAYHGEKGQIRMKIEQTPQEVCISIADSAGGIKKEIQEMLFKQMITTKGRDGTGLGLYISFSTVVGMFGGKMWFESVEGEGTEFFISLPLGSVDEGG